MINSCPDFKSCDYQVTRDFYNRICNGKQSKNCHIFAKRHKNLKNPVDWLVSTAVQEAHIVTTNNELGRML